MLTEAESLTVLQSYKKNFPETLFILGSGWNRVLESVQVEAELTYEDLFGVQATVPGHSGKLVIGKLGSKRIACMAGRFHMYEGFTARQATLPIRVFSKMGVKTVVITSASGGLNPHYKVGDFVVLRDVLSLFLALDNPLIGPQFLDVSQLFDPELRKRAKEFLTKESIAAHEGVYAYYHGPNYETPTDKMAFHHLGADVVGMSTVPEAFAAKWEGMKVLGLSFVTNLAFVKHDHKDVVAQAEAASEKMSALLKALLDQN